MVQSGFANLVNASAVDSALGATPVITTGQTGSNSETVLVQNGNDNTSFISQGQ